MFTRRIDNLGRIVIPMDLRKQLNIELGNYLNIQLDGNAIVVKKANNNPVDELKTVIEKQDDKELKAELLDVLSTHTRGDTN